MVPFQEASLGRHSPCGENSPRVDGPGAGRGSSAILADSYVSDVPPGDRGGTRTLVMTS